MSNVNLKILHAPLEIAGQVGLITEYLRKCGYSSMGFNYFINYLGYQKVFNTDSYELVKALEGFKEIYDIFHFHNSCTFLEDHRDLDFLQKAGKKIIMHHRGNDVRFRTLASKGKGYSNPYVNTDSSLTDRKIEEKLSLFSEKVDVALVQDYELYYYVIDFYSKKGVPVYILPRLIDTNFFKPCYPSKNNTLPIIVHAPTNRDFKGSDFIDITMNQLKKDYSFEYITVEGMSHSEALEYYKKADIIIDQLLCGAYGNLSVEAMALGKPVICYIREDLINHYPSELPIINANPDSLYEKLKIVIKDIEYRVALGKKGRSYVEKYHDGSEVIKQLLSIYQNL